MTMTPEEYTLKLWNMIPPAMQAVVLDDWHKYHDAKETPHAGDLISWLIACGAREISERKKFAKEGT